jgi:hypothetical protein
VSLAYGPSGELIDTSAIGYAMTAWRDPINDPPPLNTPVLAIASEYLGDRFNAGGGYLIDAKGADPQAVKKLERVIAQAQQAKDKPKETTT